MACSLSRELMAWAFKKSKFPMKRVNIRKFYTCIQGNIPNRNIFMCNILKVAEFSVDQSKPKFAQEKPRKSFVDVTVPDSFCKTLSKKGMLNSIANLRGYNFSVESTTNESGHSLRVWLEDDVCRRIGDATKRRIEEFVEINAGEGHRVDLPCKTAIDMFLITDLLKNNCIDLRKLQNKTEAYLTLNEAYWDFPHIQVFSKYQDIELVREKADEMIGSFMAEKKIKMNKKYKFKTIQTPYTTDALPSATISDLTKDLNKSSCSVIIKGSPLTVFLKCTSEENLVKAENLITDKLKKKFSAS